MKGMILSVRCKYFSGSKTRLAILRWGSALRSASIIICCYRYTNFVEIMPISLNAKNTPAL